MKNSNNLDDKILLSANDIKILCGVGQNTAYKILDQLPTVNMGGKKCTREDLENYIESNKYN
ncbi:MAG: hypothetical protein ACI4VF_09950 [Lachnospirales bacterium]